MNLKQMIFYNKLKRGNKINCDFRFKGGVVYSTLNEDQLNLPEKYQIIDGKVYYKDKPICEFKQSDDISMDTFEISDSFIEEATKDKKESKEEKKEETKSESKEEKKEETKSESKEEKKEETKSESESKEEKEAEEDEDEYEDEDEDEIDFTKVKRLFFPVRRLFGKIKNIFTKKESNIEIPEEVKKEENKDDKDKKDSKKEEINNKEKSKETKNKEKTSEKKETEENKEFNKNKEEAIKLIQKIVDELNEIHNIIYSRKDLDFSSQNDEIKNIRSVADKAYCKLQNNKKVNLDELKEFSIKAETVKKRMLATSNNNPKVEPIDFSKEKSKAKKEEPKKEETKTTKEEPKKEETKTTKEEPKNKTSKKNDFVNDIKNTIESYDKKAKHFKEIEEKIAYYEEFLNTHDLSHADDQGMKQRMEEKLNKLRNEYSALKSYNDSHKNEIVDEKMAFYTQSAMGIDKNIDKLEKERQYRILKAELEGKTIVNLGLAEERKIDAKKAELLRLKEECLRRKAEEKKYYEEIAARMTSALKR